MTSTIFPILRKIFSFPVKSPSRLKTAWRIAQMASCAGGIAINLYKLYDLSEDKIKEISTNIVSQIDASEAIAPDASEYMFRLDNLLKDDPDLAGCLLNYKIYMSARENALSFPDGSIRIDSGLMDKLDDDELLFVIGHEIGHILKRHSLKNMRAALITQTIGKSFMMICPHKISKLAPVLMSIGDTFINARYSQKNEMEADEYGFMFLKGKSVNTDAASRALMKIIDKDDDKLLSPFLTHPTLQKRVERLDRMAKEDKKIKQDANGFSS